MAYFFGQYILYNSTVSNLKNKLKILKYSYFLRKCFFLTISTIENFTFKIRNIRIVEEFSPEEVNHDL